MTFLSRRIADRLNEDPARPCLFWEEQVISRGDLDRRARAIAGGLARRGVRPGDRVAVSVPNSADLVAAVVGVLYSGAVLVPLNPAYTADELRYVLDDCGIALVVAHPVHAQILGARRNVVRSLDELDGPLADLSPREAEDPALMIYTSGTTARPKGAVLPNRALVSNLTTVAEAWGWTENDRVLLTLPCFHLHGLGLGILTSLMVGSSIVLRPRFVAEEALTLIARHRCSMFLGVPTIYNRLVALPDAVLAAADLSSVRMWISGSAPLTTATYEEFRRRFGFALMDRYGMTEACFVLCTPADRPRRAGNVGRPFPGIEVRLVDPEAADAGTLRDVADGEIGELVFRGPNLFSGYWQRPEETARCHVQGFFRSGDMAVREPDGMYRIAGRRSIDIIKSRGFKISAIEIENVLQQHPDVLEVAVVGLPDADLGEAITAVVAPRPGATLDAGQVRAFARDHLAPQKVPARVELMSEIPRTGPGKFKKRELVERLSTTPCSRP